MQNARDALKEALQNSFDEHETSPWIVQFYAQDEISWDNFQEQLRQYVHPRARGSHLAENDLKGDLKFIERAVGIQKAKAWYEKEKGEPVGIRELSRKLTDDGYPVSHSHISRSADV